MYLTKKYYNMVNHKYNYLKAIYIINLCSQVVDNDTLPVG
jgi:hypothetical protein